MIFRQAILRACDRRVISLAMALITFGAANANDALPPMHQAVFDGDVESVSLLIDDGESVNAKTLYGVTPLEIACRDGNSIIANQLIDAGADVAIELPGRTTLLMLAARCGDRETVGLLIENDADVNATERQGQTALMWAAAAGNAEAIDALVSAGAELEATSRTDFTALGFACRQGHRLAAQRLVEAGADLRRTMAPKKTSGRNPRKGMSPLMLAVESGHFELAMWLIDRGADPNDQRSGYTPLHAVTWVRKTNRGDDIAGDPPPRGSGNLNSLDFVRRWVASGGEINTALRRGPGGKAKLNRRGATAFLLAAKTADLPLLELLVELGADPTMTNVDQCDALMAASGIGVVAVGEEAGTEDEVLATIDWLVELGLDPNAIDQNGETAMHGAAYRNFPRVVARLAELGAKSSVWNQKNKYGWTPKMIASGSRPGSFKPSPETIEALEAALLSGT